MTEQKTFLIVDDDEVFTQVLARALAKRDYRVIVSHNVCQADNLSKSIVIDRAVVDLKMDGDSGLILIPKLKQKYPSIEIVMLTGYSSIATAVEAVKLGAINYLCKPANTNEILAAFDTSKGNAEILISEQPVSVDRLAWEHIQQVLKNNNGNVSATARALGMHRRTLQRKLQKKPVKH
jgi:two-component system response regulator RegA